VLDSSVHRHQDVSFTDAQFPQVTFLPGHGIKGFQPQVGDLILFGGEVRLHGGLMIWGMYLYRTDAMISVIISS
jgi:hypothetical protein